MNSSRKLAVLLALPALLGFVTAPTDTSAAEIRREKAHHLSAEGIEGLRIQNPTGLVEVRGEAREEFHFDVLYRVRAKKQVAQDVAARLSLGLETKAGWLEVVPLFDDKPIANRLWGPLRKVKLQVDIIARVPRQLILQAGVTSGDLRIQDLDEDVQLSSTSGEVEVQRLSGDLTLSATSGDLLLNDLRGRVEVTVTTGDIILSHVGNNAWVHSLNGDIFVSEVKGDLEVQTMTGDVGIKDIKGTVTVTSSSGEILVEHPDGPVHVNSSSGDITVLSEGPKGQALHLASSSGSVEVVLLEEASFDLDLNTSIGSIRCRLPLEIQEISRQRLAAILGKGGEPLQIVTASGDIRILLEEDR